jgi:hypothetical protein
VKALAGIVLGLLLLAVGWVTWSTMGARAAQEDRLAKILERTEAAMAARDPRDESARVLRDLEQARDLPRDRRLLVAQARLLMQVARVDAAVQKLVEASQLAPLTAEESVLLGRMHERRYCIGGDETAGPLALQSFRQAAEASGQPAAWYAALRMAARLGSKELEQQIRERLMADAESVYARRLRASQAVAEGRFDEGLRGLDEVAGEFDEEAEFHVEAGQCSLQSDSPDVRRARLEIEQALRQYPSLLPARSAGAVLYHVVGERTMRDGHLEWLIRTHPHHPDRRDWESLKASPAGAAAASAPGSRPGR